MSPTKQKKLKDLEFFDHREKAPDKTEKLGKIKFLNILEEHYKLEQTTQQMQQPKHVLSAANASNVSKFFHQRKSFSSCEINLIKITIEQRKCQCKKKPLNSHLKYSSKYILC